MDRSREARRGSMAAMNGAISRRRPRSSSLRDSPEEDGAMEMQESGRLRERASKKERDRDRSSRSKRRRGDRMIHGSGREEGEETSDESLDEEEEEEEEEDVPLPVRHTPPVSLPSNGTATTSWSLPPSNHLRKSFPGKDLRPPAAWKTAEMIGVPIPRKARSGTGKRSQDCWTSGGGAAAASGDPIHRQPSTSPARPSQATVAPISPSSSNASLKKKIKPIIGSKQRPPKIAKSSPIQPIEMEVAQVLFGLTRQFQPKQDGHKLEEKEVNCSSIDSKLKVSSPILMAPSMPHSGSNPAPMHVTAPKRKRPRLAKLDDESSASPASSTALSGAPASSGSKPDSEKLVTAEASSPRPEKVASTPVANGDSPVHPAASQTSSVAGPPAVQQDLPKPEKKQVPDAKPSSAESEGLDRPQNKLNRVTASGEAPIANSEVKLDDANTRKPNLVAENQKEEKVGIDLMVPPPGKLSPEREEFPNSAVDHKTVDSEIKLKIHISSSDEDKKPETKPEAGEILHEGRKEREMYLAHGLDLKAQVAKERSLDLHLDVEKHHKEDPGSGEQQQQQQVHSQQAKPPARMEKPDKAVSVPMPVGSWSSNVPPFGYMGQMPPLPPVFPMDPSSGASKSMQPPNFFSQQPRPKRCATHCYIAQNIHYHQQIAKMNPFWPVAAGNMVPYGSKPYNLNAFPPQTESASILGNPLQGSLPGRSSGAQHDKGAYLSKEKSSSTTQPPAVNNMLHGPALIFSLNQQPAGAAVTANQSAAVLKSAAGVGNGASSSTATNAGAGSGGTGPSTALSFNYAVPANETQYVAILQNNGYPFSISAAVGAHPAYRGGAPAQAMAFFNGSFYSSQMLHPSQIQQQARAQQALQNPSTSSGSSSSHKHPQQSQQQLAGGAAGPAAAAAAASAGLGSQSFPASKQRQNLLTHQAEAGSEDVPSTADIRALPGAHKAVYGQNFPMPVHPQNFALISPAAALGGGASHGEKQQPSHQPTMKVELTPSQAFALSFASLNGTAASAGAPPPGLDFSSMAQNHAFFQSLPDAARPGYQITAAAAAAAQAAQHLKKSQQILEDGKSSGDAGEEDRKIMTGSKAAANVSQQSLNFARPDHNPSVSPILSNSVMDGAPRTLSLIPSSANGSGMPHRTSNSGATTSSTATTSVNAQASQQQQQLIHLQKQQQHQQFQLQHQLASRAKSSASSNNANLYSDRHPTSSTTTRYPQALTGFPQALIQTGSTSQSPQWKNSTRSATTASSSNPVTSSMKINLPQQQARISQQSIPSQGHQTQISFGMNSLKMTVPTGQQLAGGSNMPSASTPVVIGSPQNSTASRSSAGSSPRSSTNAKPSPLPATSLPLSQQAQPKSSSSTPASNRNMPSILGQPHISPAQNSSTAKQQQNQPHQKQQQPLPQHHIFFSSAYMPAQSSQSSASAAAAAAYYQRHQSQQPQQQQTSVTSSTAMLSLTSSTTSLVGASVTSDPAKAASASSAVKGLHPAVATFPYIHTIPSVSVTPAEQKQAAGNDHLNASWQPPDNKR